MLKGLETATIVWTRGCSFASFLPSSRQTKPRFQFTVDRRHALYRHHERALSAMQAGTAAGKELHALMMDLEAKCIREVDSYLDNPGSAQELQELFKDVVETEIKFYK